MFVPASLWHAHTPHMQTQTSVSRAGARVTRMQSVPTRREASSVSVDLDSLKLETQTVSVGPQCTFTLCMGTFSSHVVLHSKLFHYSPLLGHAQFTTSDTSISGTSPKQPLYWARHS